MLFLGDNDEMPIDNNQMDGTKEVALKKLKLFCRKNNLPGFVIDSAAGDQYSAVLATACSTEIVCCMRPTMQFRLGTFNYLNRLANNNAENNLILLPTVVPERDVIIDGEYQKKNAISNILKRTEKLLARGLSVYTDFISEEMFGINEVQRFMWKEGVLYKIAQEQELIEDEKKACERYRKLAELIASLGD